MRHDPPDAMPTALSGRRIEILIHAGICLLLVADAWRMTGLAASQPGGADAGLVWDRALIVAAAAGALGIGLARHRLNVALTCVIGALVGVLYFARTLGVALLDPHAVGWLLVGGDLAEHYSSWAMFRHTPWSWPPGLLPELLYPVGSSVVYTDSLPLLALALKPWSAWLPEPFQYIGAWMALSCVLQGVFGALLLARFTRTPAAILAGSALFVFAPILIMRFGHDTLMTQWLLLASLWLYARPSPPLRLAAEAWPWWLLGLAILVHPYLAAMVAAV